MTLLDKYVEAVRVSAVARDKRRKAGNVETLLLVDLHEAKTNVLTAGVRLKDARAARDVAQRQWSETLQPLKVARMKFEAAAHPEKQ